METLFDKKVAVVHGSAIEEYIKINYPQIKITSARSESAALEKLLQGVVTYTIVEPVRASYYMKKNNLNNLYITGEFPYDYKLRIATRNDVPIINIILNKVLDQIPDREKKSLALKWGYEKELFFDKKLLINIAIVFMIVLIFIFYLSLLNRKLHTARKSLSKINATLEQKVKEEVEKNRQKDLAMLNQSRFAQMGQVINMIAHQWRQPLNNIALIAQAMNLQCKRKQITDEGIETFKEKILLQIQQMSTTIDDFRDFFKQQKQKNNFYLNETLMSLIKIVEPILEKSQISLQIKNMNSVEINGFSNELSQAILNIIYNAKDVLVSNRKTNRIIVISLEEKEKEVMLTIHDNAGGIAKDIMANIFEPYFSTKGQQGTGIGLYMSKIIIEQHMDGKLKVSNEHEGALFTIILPRE